MRLSEPMANSEKARLATGRSMISAAAKWVNGRESVAERARMERPRRSPPLRCCDARSACTAAAGGAAGGGFVGKERGELFGHGASQFVRIDDGDGAAVVAR